LTDLNLRNLTTRDRPYKLAEEGETIVEEFFPNRLHQRRSIRCKKFVGAAAEYAGAAVLTMAPPPAPSMCRIPAEHAVWFTAACA